MRAPSMSSRSSDLREVVIGSPVDSPTGSSRYSKIESKYVWASNARSRLHQVTTAQGHFEQPMPWTEPEEPHTCLHCVPRYTLSLINTNCVRRTELANSGKHHSRLYMISIFFSDSDIQKLESDIEHHKPVFRTFHCFSVRNQVKLIVSFELESWPTQIAIVEFENKILLIWNSKTRIWIHWLSTTSLFSAPN